MNEETPIFLIPLGNEVFAFLPKEMEAARARAIEKGFGPPKTEILKDEEPFLTVEQAATLLNVSEPLLYAYVREKKIPFVKIGTCVRFEKGKLFEFFNGKGKV